MALARDERVWLDDLATGRLVEKLIRQASIAPIEQAEGSRLRGRIAAYARFVQLYRRHVRRPALEETGEPWSDAPAQHGGAAIATALRSLPLELREALLLVALAGFSHAEAAHALEIPPAQLIERLERARDRLAAQMGAATDPARDSTWRGAAHLRVIK
jgi:hypothetical protein